MTNPCRIDARKSNAKNIENDANMIEIDQKCMNQLYKKASRKIKRQRAIGPEGPGPGVTGPWARSAGRGKEFLRRLQVKVPSCIQHPAKNKHLANN